MIEIRDLKKTYRSGDVEVHALRGVNLSVEKGEFLSVVGPSGSGKSTLFNILGGLTPPTSGTVHIDGRDLLKMTDAERTELRKKTVGFVFQKYNLLPNAFPPRRTTSPSPATSPAITMPADPKFDEILDFCSASANECRITKPRRAAFRRRTAAGGDRSIDRQSPGNSAGRRTHRKPRHGKLHRRPGHPARPQPAPRPDHPHDHPRSRCRRLRPPHGPHARRSHD